MRQVWNTMAVEDVERSRRFYEALGFEVRDAPGGASCITVHPEGGAMFCLFPKAIFAGMVPGEICDTAKAHEIVQSLGAGSRDEVDAIIGRAVEGGGTAMPGAKDEPWMYGRGVKDPDGHLWAVLYMPHA